MCMPFGAETMENDPCTVETTINYNAGTFSEGYTLPATVLYRGVSLYF